MATTFSVDTAGAIKDLEALIVQTPDTFARALFQEGQIELKEVKINTPVKDGPLRASEKIIGPFRKAKRVWIIIQAGGPSATYAWEVHEDLEAFHPRGGRAKYIEFTLRASMPFLPDRIAARINSQRTFFVGRVAR